MFLQTRIELGTSLETAEDLLMEHQEFEIRAKVRSCDYHMTSYNICSKPCRGLCYKDYHIVKRANKDGMNREKFMVYSWFF